MVGMMTCLQAFGTVVYPKEKEIPWFDANVSNITKTDDMTNPPWDLPADPGAVTIPQTGTISLDTDFNAPLTYAAGDSSNVAVVVASFTVMPNDAAPEITDTPQAALTVVGNETAGTNWVGMVGDTASEKGYRWETFSNGPAPVIGETHSIRIEFDQREGEPRQIRYFVDGTMLGTGWYDNPKGDTAQKISSVSFAGSGDITALAGTNIEEKAVIEVAFKPDTPGYDFTNGCINVTVSKAAGTLRLTVVDFDGNTVGEPQDIAVEVGNKSIDVSELVDHELTPGGIYSYTIEVLDADGDPVATKYGAFEAAVVDDDDVWFLADAATDTVTGGHWDPALTPQDDFYVIEDDTSFILDQTGTNCVTRIDATVVFDTLVEANSLEVETDAFGGFVAVTSGVTTLWKAFSLVGNQAAWIDLTGEIRPAVGVPYIVRAEVDFLSDTKRVRYLVSDDAGTNFYPLANGTTQWLPFASEKTELTQVQLKGAGKLAKLEAKIADKALATVNGVKYDNMADAMGAGSDITLLTNVTVQPTEAGTWNFGTSFNVIVDMSLLPGGTYTLVNGVLTVTGPVTNQGATYLIW